MYGYSPFPQSGKCDICQENKVLGYMDCGPIHWCCSACFVGMRNQHGSEMRCHSCRSPVSLFVFPIKTEENNEFNFVAIHALGFHT
jgi:hypothetical protein